MREKIFRAAFTLPNLENLKISKEITICSMDLKCLSDIQNSSVKYLSYEPWSASVFLMDDSEVSKVFSKLLQIFPNLTKADLEHPVLKLTNFPCQKLEIINKGELHEFMYDTDVLTKGTDLEVEIMENSISSFLMKHHSLVTASIGNNSWARQRFGLSANLIGKIVKRTWLKSLKIYTTDSDFEEALKHLKNEKLMRKRWCEPLNFVLISHNFYHKM